MKRILIIVIVMLMLVLSACQPTPESDAVVNKGSGSLEEAVLEKAGPNEEREKTEGRIVWSETKSVNTEIGECSVSVSMDIETPVEPENVPVYLIEPVEFSEEYLKTVAGYLMTGEVYDGRLCKKDIMLMILDAKRLMSEHTVLEGMQSEVDNYMDFLSEEYDYAAEDNEEAKFEYITNDHGQTAMRIKSYINDSTTMNFTAYRSAFYFRVRDMHTDFFYSDEISKDISKATNIKTTYEQALTIADDAVATLFDKPFAMVSATVTNKRNYLEYLWSDEVTNLGQAYVFQYTPEYDGFPSLYIDPASIFVTEETEFAKPYSRESVRVIVDDRGIIDMDYNSCSKTVEKLNDDVKLIPFGDILERFKADIFYHSMWGSADVSVTGVEFGMVREAVKDKPDKFMIVPAWNFIGDVKSAWVEDQGKSLPALNAIDGSIITNYEIMPEPK